MDMFAFENIRIDSNKSGSELKENRSWKVLKAKTIIRFIRQKTQRKTHLEILFMLEIISIFLQ